MTPKEKAEELYRRFFNTQRWIQLSEAKEYAIWVCEEVIKSHQDKDGLALGERDIPIIDFWKQVLKELKN